MSKITFRADDTLVDRLEALGGSKSEIMREALRNYLDERDARDEPTVRDPADHQVHPGTPRQLDDRSLDELIEGRVDAFLDRRLERRPERPASPDRDVNVNVTLEQGQTGVNDDESPQNDRKRRTRRVTDGQSRLCRQCGELVKDTHVFCPNCGEKASHRAFCECGDEIRSDWAYCPRCGRRTPSADVLDRS